MAERARSQGQEDIYAEFSHDPGLETLPEFQDFKKLASAWGVHQVYPVKNFRAAGVLDWDPEIGSFILLDSDPGYNVTHTQNGLHELLHHRRRIGDPTAEKLVQEVNTNSPLFKAYRDRLGEMYSAGKLPIELIEENDAVAEEIAADFVVGMARRDINGTPIPLLRIFNNPATAIKLRGDYNKKTPPGQVKAGAGVEKSPKFLEAQPPPKKVGQPPGSTGLSDGTKPGTGPGYTTAAYKPIVIPGVGKVNQLPDKHTIPHQKAPF